MPTLAPITVTESAIERVKHLLDQRGKPSKGIRIGVRTKGCSGLSYTIEYADDISPYDEVVTAGDIQICL
jgi:iron-sulfur cluster assembly protein